SPPDRELIYSYPELRNNPIKNMITRRGCKGFCSYCFNNKWNKLHKHQHPKGIVRLRDVNSVIDEMLDLKQNWQPLKMIHIMDDDFVDSIDWLKEFLPLYKTKINLPFICNACPKHLTEEVAKSLSDAGCAVISFAIECANDNTRTKVLRRHSSDKQAVIMALNNCKKYNIRTRLLNMIGLPVSNSLNDAYETLDFSIKHKPTNSRCAVFQCYKGTELFNISKKSGYISDNGLVDGFFGTSTLKIDNKKKIARLHKLWP
ncbi:unnamed protein product, partial [marine sediment metagenome]